MDGPLISINTAAAVVGEVWVGALPPFGLLDGDVSVLVGQMEDGGLLSLLDRVTDLGRRVDALTAAVAGEVAERSPLGSRRTGWRTGRGMGPRDAWWRRRPGGRWAGPW